MRHVKPGMVSSAATLLQVPLTLVTADTNLLGLGQIATLANR